MPKSPLGARKNGRFKAVSTAPSFNKTPVGSATPPLPYPTVQDLGNSIGTTPTVRLNGDPAYVLDRSTQPSCKGDDAGTAGGVRSGTVNGEVKPVRGSGTVRFEGRPAIRVGDPCTMNGGNNPGVFVVQPEPLAIPPKAAASTEVPLTPPEPGWLERAARHYKELVSPSLHDAAGDALEKGGTLWAGGRTAAAVGGAMVASGIGAAPGAVVAGSGAATAAAGTGVSAAGGLTEGAATALDQAADYILSGQRPELLNAAMTLAQHLVLDRLTKFVPGAKAKPGTKAPLAREKPREGKPPASPTPPPLGGGGADGVGIAGSSGEGPCRVGPYGKLKGKCPAGQQAHIVPDYALRYGSRASGAKGRERIPGMPSYDEGPCICLTGGSRSKMAEHGLSHEGADPRIQAAGERTDNGPKGVALLAEIIQIAVEETSKVRPHCAEEIKREVDAAFKNVDRGKYARTTQPLPKKGAEAHGVLERGESHQRDQGRKRRYKYKSFRYEGR